nr:MAG TPA: protein of unknown function DUF488 [Caudoviricetes sp.]
MIDYRVMIAGSRGFDSYYLLESVVGMSLLKRGISPKKYNIIIVCGDAIGADKWGNAYADIYGYPVEHYPALWDDLNAEPCVVAYNKYGKPYNKLAGMNRNKTMVEISDLVIMFHDGTSSGTQNDLNLCKRLSKDFEYINYKSYADKPTSFYTGYYANLKHYPIDSLLVSISQTSPPWLEDKPFIIECKSLSPSKNLLYHYKYETKGFEIYFHNTEEYKRQFKEETLGRLEFQKVVDTFTSLANGRPVIFLCYERPEDFCHRHIVGQWFCYNGVHCEEYKI